MSFDPAALLKVLDSDKLQALVETMMLAAHADGEVGEEERMQLAKSLHDIARQTRHAEALTSDLLTPLMQQATGRIAAEGRRQRIVAVRHALGDLDSRKAALGLAIRVTAADGIVRTSERELIFDLAEGFEVDQDDAADLVREITRQA
jgi:tellurite resistance protein